MESEVKYLKEEEVSRLTGVALSSLRNSRHLKRGIPYCKIGRSVRYCWQDIVDFMERCKIATEN